VSPPPVGLRPAVWRTRTRELSLSRVLVMGILNVTPDSFSDGGRFLDVEAAVAHGRRLVADGADLVDVGGESTRPGAAEVAAGEELRRVIPVIEALAAEGVVVSVDTSKPEVARRSMEAGAEIVNDVTGLASPAMREEVAASGAGVVVMHMQGSPRTMQDDPRYADVVTEVEALLLARAAAAQAAGVPAASIALDPGIGFGKSLRHNLVLLRDLDRLAVHGHPLVVGTSRKSFLGRLTGVEIPELRDGSTAVTVALAVERGASVVRVHDSRSAREAAAVAEAIVRPEGVAE
jgi:dihydropteroate synthase